MDFKIGDRVKLTEEQEVEDFCPVEVGTMGTIIGVGKWADDLIGVQFDNHDEQSYCVFDWEIELVK